MQDSIDVRNTQVTTMLGRYLARGWALVPLHGVTAGACSCRAGSACRSAGKHPIAEAWQRPEHLVRDETALWGALSRWPSCNWGLATGLISGVWALDYDPSHVVAGEEGAVAAVLADCWAAATWVQRTGGGGLHFLFTLPPDFVPNNGTGRLPAGFDVRGARRGEAGGGQIVIAPSVTDKGAYEVLQDRPPAGAPGGVLEAVRPAPPKPRAAPVPLAVRDQGAVTNYVVAAVNGEVQRLAAAPVGQRNSRAAATARRLIELVNTDVVDRDAVFEAWWRAGKAHPDPGVTVPDAELTGVWGRAERDIGDRPADLAHVGGPAGWMGGDAIFPTHAPPAPDPGSWSAGGGAGNGYPQGVHGAVDNPGDVDPVTALMARMLTPEQLDERPNPVPLINGVLDCATTAWLIGKSGSCKSFVALDIAAHVGLGREWRGRKVQQGLVIYIVAEGDQGMKLRQAAWRDEYGPIKDVLFLPEPVQADERRSPGLGQWSVLVEACRRLNPALVIIDTQARVTIGLNENDNGDMSYYAEQADRIKRACGACVLTVHHIGRQGSDARGASSLDGAQDAELKVVRSQMMITLSMDKQKDQAEAPDMVIPIKRVERGTDPNTGRDLSSLVLDHRAAPALGEGAGHESNAAKGERRALELFKAIHDRLPNYGEGIVRSQIRGLFMGLPEIKAMASKETRDNAFISAWALLLERGRMMRYGTSQRFAALPPPDGAEAGLITRNTGGPDDAPPSGWSLHWTTAEWDNETVARAKTRRDLPFLGDDGK